MSLIKKVVLSYAKSLFQNVNASKPSNDVFEVSNITTKEDMQVHFVHVWYNRKM